MFQLDDARIRTAEAIFNALLDLPAEQQPAVLTARCGSDLALRAFVEQLLQSDSGVGDDVLGRLRLAPAIDEPREVGRYRIVGRIGEGGMGVVYEAVQQSPQRHVAIKLIRHGLTNRESLRRFRREAELLGQLEHPGIARIYEAGAADVNAPGWRHAQQPYLAMELVRGEPLARYVERAALDLPAVLELLARLCDIVQFAHQKGVIHRDLKPANILVDTSGQPRVLDFGVARAARADLESTRTADTEAGQLLGTLTYMSPEQLAGDPQAVDTRSDIYSLGVIAYELLCGRLPLDLSGQPLPQAIRSLAESEPRRAGSIRPHLKGDVDAILSRALEKNPDRRYASAAEFAADIRRHLRHEPVLARPPSALYQFRKFARRNRALVAGAGLTLAALLAGLAGTATFAWRERQQAEHTQVEAARAQAVIRFLREMLAAVDPQAVRGRDVTVRQVLDTAAERIQSGELTGQPEVEAALRSTIGETYHSLGHAAVAIPHLQAAVKLFEELHGPLHDDVIANTCLLAAAVDDSGDAAEAERLTRRALDAARRLHGAEHRVVARVMGDLGVCLREQYKLEEAEECHKQVLALRRKLPKTTPDEVATSLSNLAGVYMLTGRLSEAEPLVRETLEIRRRLFPADHPAVARAVNGWAVLLHQLDRLEEAEPFYRESLDIYRRVLEPRHPDVAITLSSFGALHLRRGRTAEALPLLREALEISMHLYPPDAPSIASVRLHLAAALNGVGDHAAAAEEARQGLASVRKAFGDRHSNTAGALRRIASQCIERSDLAAAERLLLEALDILEHLDGPDRVYAADVRESLGAIWIELDRAPEAVECLDEALVLRRAALGDQHWKVGRTWGQLAAARLRAGDAPGAVSAADVAVERLRTEPGRETDLAMCLLTCIEAGLLTSDFSDAAAETTIDEATRILHDRNGRSSWQAAEADRIRGLCLLRAARHAESEAVLLCALETLDADTASPNPELRGARRSCRAALAALYDAWHETEPNGGFAERAVAWRATVEQPAAATGARP